MTVDHIIPKKVAKELGWSKAMIEALDNKQTMCDPCNGAKGHKVFTEKELESYRRQMRNNQPKQHKESKALVSLVPNIHALLGDKNVLA
jgi:5-methylcytosine-specific restriction endonuclease McrA